MEIETDNFETKINKLNDVDEINYLPYLLNNKIREKSTIPIPNIFNVEYLPINNQNLYVLNEGTISFLIHSINLLDPYSLILEFTVINENENDLQLDGSAHSLIKSIQLFSNGIPFETIENYDLIQYLKFDQSLTKKDRIRRRKEEGFGTNQFGTNEVIIPAKDKYTRRPLDPIEARVQTEITQSAYPNYDDSTTHKISNEFKLNQNLFDKASPGIPFYDDPYTYGLGHLNDWSEVKNGKITPCIEEFIDIQKKRNEYTFKIPLQLKTIGFGQEIQNYKLVPLVLFSNLTINITFNKDAFFVPAPPIHESSLLKITNTNEPFDIKLNSSRKYLLQNVKLHMTHYAFSEPYHSTYVDQIVAGGFTLDYIDLSIKEKRHVFEIPTFEIARSDEQDNLRAIFMIFTNDLYLYSNYARKYARYNHGLEDLKFHMNNMTIPLETSFLKQEHSSLNTSGLVNCDYFYRELYDTLGLKEGTVKNLLTKKNFCIDYDYSHLFAIQVLANQQINALTQKTIDEEDFSFVNKNWGNIYKKISSYLILINHYVDKLGIPQYYRKEITKFNKIIDQPTSKCIYAINFERTPFLTRDFRSGFGLEKAIDYKISFKKSRESTQKRLKLFGLLSPQLSIYHYITLFYESYRTIRLTGNGDFVELKLN